MNVKQLLEKELSYEEINEFLHELMNFSCNNPEDTSVPFRMFDDNGELFDFRKIIGTKGLDTLNGILFFKEKIDEKRGEDMKVIKLRQMLNNFL
jgi:hypothetical protein